MNKEREKSILEIAIKEKSVTVKDLARRLYSSEPSIRRDLCSLEKQGLLRRTHGGAVLNDEKIKIARIAADLVTDESVIFLDASTSAYFMIPFLTEKRNLIVITNGIKALTALSENNINCIGTGGEVINSCLAFVGEEAHRTIEHYNADFCFFACRGISEDGRLTDISQPENLVRLKMLEHSKQSFMLCTSDKMNTLYYHNLCSADDIGGVIRAE